MGDEEIEPAIVVVIEPERARRKSAVGDAGRLRDVGEPARAHVLEQPIAAESREVDVDAAVVIEVGRGGADPVQLNLESRSARDVGEGAVVVVAVQRRNDFDP